MNLFPSFKFFNDFQYLLDLNCWINTQISGRFLDDFKISDQEQEKFRFLEEKNQGHSRQFQRIIFNGSLKFIRELWLTMQILAFKILASKIPASSVLNSNENLNFRVDVLRVTLLSTWPIIWNTLVNYESFKWTNLLVTYNMVYQQRF